MKRQRIGLRRIALEEARLCLTYIHDIEERGVREQLDELVGTRRRGRHEAVGCRALVESHEFAEGLRAAEAAERGRLVEAHDGEAARIKFAVADTLIVSQVNPVAGTVSGECVGLCLDLIRFAYRADEVRLQPKHRGIADKLLSHAEREDYQAAPADPRENQADDLELHDRLAETERRKDRAAAAANGPDDRIALMWFQERMHVGRIDIEAAADS